MFKALEGEAYTIKVNSGASSAQYTILSQQRVVPLLNSLMQPPAASGTENAARASLIHRNNMAVHKYNMGVIGNCTYLAYIDLLADVKWMCMPRFDSSFLFGSLLDEEKGGHFFIRPAGDEYRVHQYYVPNTNVLCTEFTCRDGRFVVKDFAPRIRIYERQFRPLMLVRKVELLEGEPCYHRLAASQGETMAKSFRMR